MTTAPQLFDTIFREKPALMLIHLLQDQHDSNVQVLYASNLAKKVDCTYSHVVKILKEFEEHGLVSFKKKGRLKLLSLTAKGERIAEHLTAAYRLLP
ncbi:MAG: winged helix DNA-binding protein [Candidatus Woesearchaeota archaeon]